MRRVLMANGARFDVDADPVTVRAFREWFTQHDPGADPNRPVTNVSYAAARMFAVAHGGRLLTAEEWDAATNTVGVHISDGLLEWVEGLRVRPRSWDARVRQWVGDSRNDEGYPNVTFRVVKDP